MTPFLSRPGPLLAGLCLAVSLVPGRALPQEKPTQPAEHRIAVLLPESGPFTPQGILLKQGYQLAESRLQQRRSPVRVRYFDTGPPTRQNRDLIYQQVLPWQPDLVVGPYDSETALATVRELSRLEVPLLIPTAMLDRLTQQPHPGIFRIATPLHILCLVTADFLGYQKAEWDFDRVVLLADRSLLSEGLIPNSLEGALTMRGLGPLTSHLYAEGSPPLHLDVTDKTVLILNSHSSEDCKQLIRRYGARCRIVGFLMAFAAPDLRNHVRRLPKGSYKGLYCVQPWDDDRTRPANAAFVQEYRAKFALPVDLGWPDYHSAQAYSALLTAAHALEESPRTGAGPADALRQVHLDMPIGRVHFINFVDYYQQCAGSATVLEYGPGESQVVYPFGRVLRLAEEYEPAGQATPPRSPLLLLLDNQIVTLFAVLSLGLLLGQIKVKGVALGMAGIFVVGMGFGYLGFTAPDQISTLGVIFLLYGVGLGAGPTFFQAFRQYGKRLVLAVGAMILAAAVTTVALAWLAGIPADLAAGVFAGAMKSSAAFAAALDRLPGQTTLVAVGYGISYPISLLTVVLLVQVLPRLMRQDVSAQNQQLRQQRPAHPKIRQAMVELQNTALEGRKLAELSFIAASNCRILQVLHGDHLVPLPPDAVFHPGLRVLVIGPEEPLAAVIEYLGRETEKRGLVAADYRQMEIVVTARSVIGKTVGELNPLVRHGVLVQELQRLGHTFVPRDDQVLQHLDVLRVVGAAGDVDQFARAVGHRTKALQQTDLLSLAVGIGVGVVLGTIPIGLRGGSGFMLGMGGGPLVVALVLSYLGRVGWVVGHFPPATQLLLVRLGLALLLAGAAVKAGTGLVSAFSQYGWTLVAMVVVVTAAGLVSGLAVCSLLLKQTLLEALAIVSGGTNATPAYEALSARADSDIVLAIFTTAYATAMILMVLAVQVVIGVLQI